MKTTTPLDIDRNPGAFWRRQPARVRSAEEIETIRELVALALEEEAKENAVLAEWLQG